MAYLQRCPTVVYEAYPDAAAQFGLGNDGDSTSNHTNNSTNNHTNNASNKQRPLVRLQRILPHLAKLSVDGLSLTPLFPAADALRLHIEDFFNIDPNLGTTEDLVELCEEARKYNISILLMGVFDHVSHRHPWFLGALQQEDDEGLYQPEQRTRRFFSFGSQHVNGYACRDGSPEEPELNLANAEVRRRLFTSEDSVVHFWLRCGAAGWRISRAEQVGYSILRECSRGALTVDDASIVIGDIKGFADRYVRDGVLDGVVNHYLREAVISYLRGQVPARQLARVMRDLQARYGTALLRSWNAFSGHDQPRLASLLQDRRRIRLATLLSYCLPGSAHILHGDEVGMGPVSALAPMPEKSHWDDDTLRLYIKLGKLRRRLTSLCQGEFVDLTPEGEEEIFAFARVTNDPRETVVCVINRASQTRVRKLFAPVCDLPDGLQLRDVLSDGDDDVDGIENGDHPHDHGRIQMGPTVRAGTLTLEIDGQDARILIPDDRNEACARFFRGY